MIVCHICGSQNDPSNRFCDQCGARLDPTSAPVSQTAGEQPQAIASITCPACGAVAIPGQAFCDNCGYDLRTSDIPDESLSETAPSIQGPSESDEVQPDTETMLAGPADQPAIQPSPDAEATTVAAEPAFPENQSVVPVPGDNEADTEVPKPASQAEATPSDETVMAHPSGEGEAAVPDATAAPDEVAMVPDATAAPDEVAMVPDAAAAPDEVAKAPDATAAPDETVIAPDAADPDAKPKEQASESRTTTATDVSAELDPRYQQLEEEIARHQATIVQMEQMLQAYPSGQAPAYLNQGIDSARREKEDAEKKLAALKAGPDPAEISRLEEIISVHKDTIAQFEKMEKNYPAGTAPSFLEDGIKEASRALEQAEKDLEALRTGKIITAASQPIGGGTGPRLELFDGKHEFPLPTDKIEFIIGREDPVSQIFPEVDLTSFGGEAGGVSRQHARINRNGNDWTVTDLDSTNHTRVDGQKVEPNTPTPIQDGTRVQFGRIAAVFRL